MAKALGVLSSIIANSHFEVGGKTPALSSRRAAATIFRPISLILARRWSLGSFFILENSDADIEATSDSSTRMNWERPVMGTF